MRGGMVRRSNRTHSARYTCFGNLGRLEDVNLDLVIGIWVVVDFLEKCQMERSARVICGPHGAHAAPGYEKSVSW